MANKNILPVTCSGGVKIETVAEDTYHDIEVKNVLCVLQLTINLLSVSKIIKKDNIVNCEANCCKIYNKDGNLNTSKTCLQSQFRVKHGTDVLDI